MGGGGLKISDLKDYFLLTDGKSILQVTLALSASQGIAKFIKYIVFEGIFTYIYILCKTSW